VDGDIGGYTWGFVYLNRVQTADFGRSRATACVNQNVQHPPMRFTLIDHIVKLEPDDQITAVKTLTMAEEYLADHFPHFPVMPGVLMLEALTQSAAWLVRVSEDFAHSMIVLKEARNVKYGQFVEPGQTMTITARITKQDDRETRFSARATVNGRTTVSGRLVLERYNLAERVPDHAGTDEAIKKELRELLATLRQPQAATMMS
jgi:3-hydroxyacyl-[acyl-carrier-protein] dehydratase